MSAAAVPRLAARIVHAALPSNGAEAYIADLEERFERLVESKGVAAARRWYWRQAFGFALRVPVARLNEGLRSAWEQRAVSPLVAIARDFAYAARTLKSRPGFTIPAVLILAIAIAANSAALSIVDKVLLRSLPFDDPDTIAVLWDRPEPGTRSDYDFPVTYNHFVAWEARTDLFDGVAAMETTFPVVGTDEYPIRVNAVTVSASLFSLLGATPALGRLMSPEDDRVGADPVVILSDRLWRRSFGADPQVVGRTIPINSVGTTVIGVMPGDFWFFDPYMWARSIGERDTAQPDLW